jgi:hypothetical protein
MRYGRTKTGDLVQVRECNENDITYGIISIKLKNTYSNLNDAEKTLRAFMERLQQSFAIQHATGLHVETFLMNGRSAITNYWQDAAQRDWKVKGWTDGARMAVLYIKNIGLVSVAKEEYFLDGAFFIRA